MGCERMASTWRGLGEDVGGRIAGARMRCVNAFRGRGERRLLCSMRGRAGVFVVAVLTICLWQRSFWNNMSELDRTYQLEASSGLHQEIDFVYFFHFLGLFPVASERSASKLAYSRAGAEREIREHGDRLLTERGHSTRYGELGKSFLYLPSVWLNGWAQPPNIRTGAAVVFTTVLIVLFAVCWWLRRPLLGTLLVAFIGSNPFQLFEIYARHFQPSFFHPQGHDNIFPWLIITAVAILAVNLPLFTRRRLGPYCWVAPLLSGVLFALAAQLRTEPVAVAGAVAVCYAIAPRRRWWVRGAMIGLLFAALSLTGGAVRCWFRAKITEAERVVKDAGGHVYPGPRDFHHLFWHPLWVGLGDFDPEFEWRDGLSAEFAVPRLKEKYGVEVPTMVVQTAAGPKRVYKPWDEAGKYYRQPHELDHFGEVLRDDLLSRIGRRPFWYAGILWRRVIRVLSQTTPVRVAWGRHHLPVPFSGWLVLPILGLLIWARAWFHLRMLVLLGGTSATAILVYSGGNTPFYSTYHIASAAVACSVAVDFLLLRCLPAPAIRDREGASVQDRDGGPGSPT